MKNGQQLGLKDDDRDGKQMEKKAEGTGKTNKKLTRWQLGGLPPILATVRIDGYNKVDKKKKLTHKLEELSLKRDS